MDSGSDTADEWVKSAMHDERLVAKLLLHMQVSDSYHTVPPHLPRNSIPPTCWGAHKSRTKQSEKKEKEQIRRSPTTPLSWSGGDIGSGGSGASPSEGYEESSRPSSDRFVDGSGGRFKNTTTNDSATPPTPPCKRSRRKKTYAQLKEEEDSLLKERMDLKKELASVRMTLKEERSLNERLKRRKLDLQVKQQLPQQVRFKLDTQKRRSGSCLVSEAEASNSSVVDDHHPCTSATISKRMKLEAAAYSSCQQDVSSSSGFVLPDLNAMPDEESGCVGS